MYKIQKIDLLISIYMICIALSELMGGKTIQILSIGTFHLSASVAIFVLPLIYGINDVIIEVYGKDRAKSIVYSGLISVVFILIFSLFATGLPPTARFAPSESAYDTIFGISARISASSLIAFIVAEFMDIYIFTRLKNKLGNNLLWFRTNVSNILSQFVDTTIFMAFAFYSFDLSLHDNYIFLLGLILPYWLLKCCMSILETPLVYAGVKWLRNDS